jgi:hypothetical protein
MKCLVRFLFAVSIFLILGICAFAQRITSFHSSHARQSVCAANQYIISYTHGEPDFVPSVYMDYEKALELGKTDAGGAIQTASQANGFGLPASDRQSMSVVQDNHRRLVICGVDVTSC